MRNTSTHFFGLVQPNLIDKWTHGGNYRQLGLICLRPAAAWLCCNGCPQEEVEFGHELELHHLLPLLMIPPSSFSLVFSLSMPASHGRPQAPARPPPLLHRAASFRCSPLACLAAASPHAEPKLSCAPPARAMCPAPIASRPQATPRQRRLGTSLAPAPLQHCRRRRLQPRVRRRHRHSRSCPACSRLA